MEQNKKIDKYINKLELEYSAVFIPFSQSRNAKEIKSLSDYSINWTVTIKSLKNGQGITTDYMQGIGHLPESMQKYTRGSTLYNEECIKYSCENGKACKRGDTMFWPGSKLTPPDLKDVLYCLFLDAEACDYDFADWAGNYGYDEDSRSAEKLYNECVQIGLKLRRVLGGDSVIEKLRELYQDY